jgi:hypothetical protein
MLHRLGEEMAMASTRSMAVVLLVLVFAAARGGGAEDAAIARPRYPTRCVLEAVLDRMNVPFREDLEVPAVLYESTTPLRRFQRATAPQWGFRPAVFANVYVSARNEIYLVDAADAYRPRDGSIDDSLAHELAHYVQTKYLGRLLDDDPSTEFQAVDVQRWFREAHFDGARAVSPCARLAHAGRR